MVLSEENLRKMKTPTLYILLSDVCQMLGSRRKNGIDESLLWWLDVRNEIDREIERRLVNAED